MLQIGRKSCAEPILWPVFDLCPWRQDLRPPAPEAWSRRGPLSCLCPWRQDLRPPAPEAWSRRGPVSRPIISRTIVSPTIVPGVGWTGEVCLILTTRFGGLGPPRTDWKDQDLCSRVWASDVAIGLDADQ